MRNVMRSTSATWAGVLALAIPWVFAAAQSSAAIVTVTKVSNGGVGSFTFTGNNGFASQTITTTTPGVGVSGATQALAAAGVATSITETVPPGYALVGTSCTGMGAGGTASLVGNTLSLDAAATAAGANIACTFVNTRLPTITVTKVSNGGIGIFNFTGTNGFTSQAVTTTTPGVGVSGATQTLAAAGVATTITEAVPAGYALTGAFCTGMGSGGTASLNGASLTLDAAAVAAGANIACMFVNARLPRVTVTKISNGGIGAFTFAGSNGFASQTITTTTPGVGVAGATQTLAAAGTVTTITETTPPGYALAGTFCTGMGSGGSASLVGNILTLDAAASAAGANIACTFVNTRLPTITVTKLSNGSVGAFNFTGTNGFVSQTITTTTPGVGVAGATQTLAAAGVATTISETVPAGFVLASGSCTGMGAGGTASLVGNTLTLDAAATAAGANVACTFTNTSEVTLTVARTGNGSGAVTSDVGGIDCGPVCAATYSVGAPVVLTATPGAGGSVFAGWSGAGVACPGTGTCSITMDASRTVTATFTDSAPPVTTLLSNPSNPSNQPLAVFTFGADEPGTFECSLDGQPFAGCTSPASFAVGNGPHTFSVRARDVAGNEGNTVTFGWLAARIGEVEPIPTLSAGMLAMVAAMLGFLGMVARRRRAKGRR